MDIEQDYRENVMGYPRGGTLQVIVGAGPACTGVTTIAAHLAQPDPDGRRTTVADGLAVLVGGGRAGLYSHNEGSIIRGVSMRFIPAAAMVNEDVNLAYVGGLGDQSVVSEMGQHEIEAGCADLIGEVERVEWFGADPEGPKTRKVRQRFHVDSRVLVDRYGYGAAGLVGSLLEGTAELTDIHQVARDVLRAGGTVQVQAGARHGVNAALFPAPTVVDMLAAVRIAPWASYVGNIEVVLVIACPTSRDADAVVALAEKTVLANGPVDFLPGTPDIEPRAHRMYGGVDISMALVDLEHLHRPPVDPERPFKPGQASHVVINRITERTGVGVLLTQGRIGQPVFDLR